MDIYTGLNRIKLPKIKIDDIILITLLEPEDSLKILNQYDYPDLFVKIGVDFGTNMIIRYGSDAEKSHVDILGPTMNIAAKIQGKAKPQEILIGEDVYNRIHPSVQKEFSKKIFIIFIAIFLIFNL